jgi:hypothetical protein
MTNDPIYDSAGRPYVGHPCAVGLGLRPYNQKAHVLLHEPLPIDCVRDRSKVPSTANSPSYGTPLH